MKIKATVNGKIETIEVKKQYNNGIQNMIDGTMAFNGETVWVTVEEAAVVKEKINVRTRFEYEGDREYSGECREVHFNFTSKSKEEMEKAIEVLEYLANEYELELARCSGIEEYNGEFTYFESTRVENPAEGKEVKKGFYKELKQVLAGK